MRSIYFKLISFFISMYLILCLIMYLNQESFIFHPLKMNKETNYIYQNSFKEIAIKTTDGATISNLYFEAENPKGVVYFLHGNAGNLATWGDVAPIYLQLGYNVFITDYRGFGKSDGTITDQSQLFSDAQLGYDFLKKNLKKMILLL